MAKELTLKDIRNKIDKIMKAEERMRFPEVAKNSALLTQTQ